MKRNISKYYAGAILSRMFPQQTKRLRQSFTLPNVNNRFRRGRIPRLIRYYLGEQARQDPSHLESLHRDFWRQQKPEGWYANAAGRFYNQTLPRFSPLVPRCLSLIREQKIVRVCEFGCGDGQWLNFLSEQWTEPTEFLGLDLAEEQIQINQKRYPKLRFEDGDLTRWVQDNSSPHTIFVTFCGVLENLSEETLSRVFQHIGTHAPDSLFFLIEPIANDFDLSRQLKSAPHGNELSYSHNYPKLLEDAGLSIELNIEFPHVGPWFGYRMLAILAKTRRDDAD